MKLFRFKYKQTKENPTEVNSIETWVVKWKSLYKDRGYSSFWESNPEYMTFFSEEDANDFADELKCAVKLLKNTHQTVKVYKQEPPSNL
jgi:hypothetical protein